MQEQFLKILLILISVGGSFAAYTAILRIITPRKVIHSPMSDISDMTGGESSVFGKLEGSPLFWDKVDLFFAKKMKLETKLEETYTLLGRPANTNPLKMLHLKMMIGGILPLVFIVLSGSFFCLVFAPLGFIIPDAGIWAGKVRKRQEDIIHNFPTFVDLAALMIESGLDYMTAFDRIVKISPEKSGLDLEIEKTINEVQLGYSRRDALRRLSTRTGLQEVRSFVGLIVQSDELGTSLVELLRNYAADMRFRRLNKAEKLAAQASTKMLIPLFVFIFPTVFILMLAPMVSDLVTGGMPF